MRRFIKMSYFFIILLMMFTIFSTRSNVGSYSRRADIPRIFSVIQKIAQMT